MAEITVINDDRRVPASAAVSVLNTLLRAGVAIDHRCGGHAQCGTCRIRVVEGGEFFSPIREAERLKLAKFRDNDGLRLACQSYVFGDVTIEVLSRRSERARSPEESRS